MSESRALWYCKRCRTVRGAMLRTDGKPKVATFPSGFTAVFLECQHTAAVRQDRADIKGRF